MKIPTKAIEGFISSPGQCRAVLLYGPDSGLSRERAARFRRQVLGPDADSFAFTEFEEAALLSDPARLSDELLAINMLAPKRVILIRDAGDKLAGTIREASAHFNDAVFLIVLAEELTTRSSLRGWFEAAPDAAALAAYHDEFRDVQDVIRKRLGEHGITPDRDVMEYLAQQLGNDRYVTYQELEKISLFAGDSKQLTLEDAQQLVNYNKDSNVDDMVNAIADKNLSLLEAVLQQHIREGAQPVMYLRVLQRYFNRLYAIRAAMTAGKSMDEVVMGLKPKVFYKQEQSLKRHIQNWQPEQIVKALGLLIAAELACKTSDIPLLPASSRKLYQITQLRG